MERRQIWNAHTLRMKPKIRSIKTEIAIERKRKVERPKGRRRESLQEVNGIQKCHIRSEEVVHSYSRIKIEQAAGTNECVYVVHATGLHEQTCSRITHKTSAYAHIMCILYYFWIGSVYYIPAAVCYNSTRSTQHYLVSNERTKRTTVTGEKHTVAIQVQKNSKHFGV